MQTLHQGPPLPVPAWTGLEISTEIALPAPQALSSVANAMTPASMEDFLLMLRAVVEKAPGMWPFMCDGNPLTCTVAIVGVDPGATPPFWRHWSDERGMDQASWVHACSALRGGHMDISQAALARLLPQVTSRVIELNTHAMHGIGAVELGEYYRTTDVLQFLLGAVKPSVIVCIGAYAFQVVQSIALPWTPAVLKAQELVDWDVTYERCLARRINAAQSALAIDSQPSDTSLTDKWTQAELYPG